MTESGAPREAIRFGAIVSRLAASSVVVVAVLYGFGRVFTEIYYRRFGLSASSLGFSTTDLVGEAAGAAVWFLLLGSPFFLLAFYGVLHAYSPDRTLSEPDRWTRLISFIWFALCFLVPVAAVCFFGNVRRVGDWGIPVAAFGSGFVAFIVAALSSGYVREDAPWAVRIQSNPRNRPSTTARRVAIQSTLAFAAVTLVGFVMGVVGVTIDASDARRGVVSRSAPWSLAPSATRVQIAYTQGVDLPFADCVVELGRVEGVWIFWDPKTETLWRWEGAIVLRTCRA